MVFEFTHPKILTIPQQHRTYLYEHSEPAPGTIVSLAPYDMRRYNAYYRQHPLTVYEGAVGPADHNAYVATLSVRHLILQVSGQMTGRVLGMKWADWIAPRIYEIWPFRGSLTFMPEPTLTERGLEIFADALGDDA